LIGDLLKRLIQEIINIYIRRLRHAMLLGVCRQRWPTGRG